MFLIGAIFAILFTASEVFAEETSLNETAVKKHSLPELKWNIAWTGKRGAYLKSDDYDIPIYDGTYWNFFASISEWAFNNKSKAKNHTSDEQSWDYLNGEPFASADAKIAENNWNTSTWIAPNFFESFRTVKMCFGDFPVFMLKNQVVFPANSERFRMLSSVIHIESGSSQISPNFDFSKDNGSLEFDQLKLCGNTSSVRKLNSSAITVFLGDGQPAVSVSKNKSNEFEVKVLLTEFQEIIIEVNKWVMNIDLPATLISYKNSSEPDKALFLLMTQNGQENVILGVPACDNRIEGQCFLANENQSEIDVLVNYKRMQKENTMLKQDIKKIEEQKGTLELENTKMEEEHRAMLEENNKKNAQESEENGIKTEGTIEPEQKSTDIKLNTTSGPNLNKTNDDKDNTNDESDPNNEDNGGPSGLAIFGYIVLSLTICGGVLGGMWWLRKRRA